VALSVAAITLLVALTLVVSLGWASPVIWVLLAVAAAGLERRVPDPLIDVHALRAPAVLRANLAAIGLGWALFGAYLLVPQFARADPGRAHYGLGATPAAIGAILLPLAVAQTFAGPLAGLISRRTGTRPVFAVSLGIMAAALVALSIVRYGQAPLALALFALGLGAGGAMQTSTTLATEGVGGDVAAASSALNSTVRRLAGGIGGQTTAITLAALMLAGASTPRFIAFTVAYLLAAALCLGGATVALLGGRDSR
jgi:MFS family permease